jgi:hypothetical protein
MIASEVIGGAHSESNVGADTMTAVPQGFPVKLTQAQRRVLAEMVPEFNDRLRLAEKAHRPIRFTVAELKAIHDLAKREAAHADAGTRRNSLRHVADLTAQAIDRSQGIGVIPPSERVYQFKITLKDAQPPIWRRIQVKNCTLDKLHERIQTAMGWTNSHLHDFKIDGKSYGDPLLLDENFEEFDYADSTTTKLTDILPKAGKQFRFEYQYDFGDSWWHEVLFEGCLCAEQGKRYPVCVEGARACPPEDVGGVPGYQEYLEAMADPDNERHGEFLTWRGPFDSEAFDAGKATKRMWRGLPNWRSERWV